MIKYGLRCTKGHDFEAWFRSSDTFDRQSRRKLVSCPECGDNGVERQIMAPAILKARRPQCAEGSGASENHISALRAAKEFILANSEDVGHDFALEARKIHEGESEERPIRGVTTSAEAKCLVEDGITFGIIPLLPEDHN